MLRERLLKRIQHHIPLVERPFLEIARELGSEEEKVIGTLERLKAEKIIRQISPIYDTRAVGYDSSLVAFRVSPDRLSDVARMVSSHPGVSHNYERDHDFNLWFTLAVPPDSLLGLEGTVALMAELGGVEDYVVLRTVKTYKIGVKLDYGDLKEREEVEQRTGSHGELSELEKEVVRLTQEDIPLVREPFRETAQKLGLKTEELLSIMEELKERGVMRRFSAILFHRRAGFRANGMVVWQLPEDRIDEAGYFLARFKSVSHCYRRTINQHWRYNLFSMVHGRTPEEVMDFVASVREEIRPIDYRVLFSKREFKKRRVKLFSEELYGWERRYVEAHSY